MSRRFSVSLPDDLADETDALAHLLGKARSEFVRDALRRRVQIERFAVLQRHGGDLIRKLGIGAEDAEALVDELRVEPR